MLVKDFLERIATTAETDDDDAMWSKIEDYGVPLQVIAAARWLQAKRDGDRQRQCWWAVQAGMLEEAHEQFVRFVAPTAITSGRRETRLYYRNPSIGSVGHYSMQTVFGFVVDVCVE